MEIPLRSRYVRGARFKKTRGGSNNGRRKTRKKATAVEKARIRLSQRKRVRVLHANGRIRMEDL